MSEFDPSEISKIIKDESTVLDCDPSTLTDVWQGLALAEESTRRIASRVTPLQPNVDHYTETDSGSSETFELDLPVTLAGSNDCMFISVVCMGSHLSDDYDFLFDQGPRRVTPRPNLTVTLISEGEQWEARYAADEFVISFDPAIQKIPAGRCSLVISSLEDQSRSLRVSCKIFNKVRATTVTAGSSTHGVNGSSEFTYFRFVLDDPSKLVTVRAAPACNSQGPIGDPDLYISNRYDGLTAVTKETFVWKSTNVGADRIDIHPTDPELGRGLVFIIGVLGYKEVNEWVLDVEVSVPLPLYFLPCPTDIIRSINKGEKIHFSLQVDPSIKGQMILTLTLVNSNNEPLLGPRGGIDQQRIDQNYGRGVYATDSLFSIIAPSTPAPVRPDQLYPVLYMSATCMYPSEDEFTWRASQHLGHITVVFELDEWKYTPGVCYISLHSSPKPIDKFSFGIEGTNDPESWIPSNGDESIDAITLVHGARSDTKYENSDLDDGDNHQDDDSTIRCRISLKLVKEEETLSTQQRELYAAFQQIFEDSDASHVSQNDRAELPAHEKDSSFTYGEVDFIPFLLLLVAAQAKAGEVFVDLGCGAGKAVVSAALSPVGFRICRGVELLPGLHALATKMVGNLTNMRAAGMVQDCSNIEILAGNMLEVDWTDADVVYMSSICFSDSLMRGIAEKALHLKAGARVLTLKLFPVHMERFDILDQSWYKMTWGRINVYVLVKKDL